MAEKNDVEETILALRAQGGQMYSTAQRLKSEVDIGDETSTLAIGRIQAALLDLQQDIDALEQANKDSFSE